MSDIANDTPPPDPEGETKRQRFVRLANYRTNKILERIEQLGHLSNQSQYEYTQEDVTKLRSAIEAQLETTFTRFFGKRQKKEFTL